MREVFLSARLALLLDQRYDTRHLSERPAGIAERAARGIGERVDVLSEVLKVIKLQGAIFFNAEFTAPWSFSSPPSSDLAPQLAPGVGRIVIYHLLIEGRGYA